MKIMICARCGEECIDREGIDVCESCEAELYAEMNDNPDIYGMPRCDENGDWV